MKLIRFVSQSELFLLQDVCANVYDTWLSRWKSPRNINVPLRGSLTYNEPDFQSWLSCKIGRGTAFISVTEARLISLAALILGVDESIAEKELQKDILQELLIDAYKELLNDLSNVLVSKGVNEFSRCESPSFSVGSINYGGYQFQNNIINFVLDSNSVYREVEQQHDLVARNQSLLHEKIDVEAFLPPSKISLHELLDIKKGNVLVTDTKVGSEIGVYVEGQKFRVGNLGKTDGFLALKISK
ncbi:FliM/FliN family flagellar motor C-terminal domain-containing protein [Photobacterium kasasachensis]|uniref:FliM/FliN family flagellar motor C-terminal domain-containing protein n=1 Tax=Photobacterium kasasachensis TaxID=2910240 RepID=UPI003D14569F